jgi:hypothetical protein
MKTKKFEPKNPVTREMFETNNKPTHTPTPLMLPLTLKVNKSANATYLMTPDGDCVGMVTVENPVAYADYIVRAVNSHEALLKFAKLVDEFLSQGTAIHSGSLTNDEGEITMRDKVALLIKQAEQGA